jgi:5-methylcytosine-specific restriction protein A
MKIKTEILKSLNLDLFPTTKIKNDSSNSSYIKFRENLQNIASELQKIFPEKDYKLSVNSGVGNIASCPWIGIHSKSESIDTKPQTGLYLTIIWNYDGSCVCLLFQKGTDNSSPKEIESTVSRVRNKYSTSVLDEKINLHAPSTSKRPKNYEKANIAGRNYSLQTLEKLDYDIIVLKKLYEEVIGKRKKIEELINKTENEEIDYQKPGKRRTTTTESIKWVRDPIIRDLALKRAYFKCELDNSHQTFIYNQEQFMEGHHLIPIEYQHLFTNSLDVVSNIISLCPNCHRKIHYGEPLERIEMATKLYNIRALDLEAMFKVTSVEIYYDDI